VVQQPHRMHSHRPSSSARSSGALQALVLRLRVQVDQVGLHGPVVLVELGHVHDQVADHAQARQGADGDGLLQAFQRRDAGQHVGAVDVDAIGTAHPFPAGAAEGQALVQGVLDGDEGVQHLLALGIEVDVVILHARGRAGFRVVAIDAEFHDWTCAPSDTEGDSSPPFM
jgi:hypothetical protein